MITKHESRMTNRALSGRLRSVVKKNKRTFKYNCFETIPRPKHKKKLTGNTLAIISEIIESYVVPVFVLTCLYAMSKYGLGFIHIVLSTA